MLSMYLVGQISCTKLENTQPTCFLGICYYQFDFPWYPCLKTDSTSFFVLFSVKEFKEKEIEFLTEQLLQKKTSNCWYKRMVVSNLFQLSKLPLDQQFTWILKNSSCLTKKVCIFFHLSQLLELSYLLFP